MRPLSALAAILVFCSPTTAIADEWTVSRLRGVVLHLEDGTWERLERGMSVPDDRLVRTLNARATFERGKELIELSPHTIIQISDRSVGLHTVVINHSGTVGIEVDVRDVDHFSVVTPHLAAVVKGTKFSVSANDDGSSVEVERGQVLMRDTAYDQLLLVSAGETAETGDGPAVATPSDPQSNDILETTELQNTGSHTSSEEEAADERRPNQPTPEPPPDDPEPPPPPVSEPPPPPVPETPPPPVPEPPVVPDDDDDDDDDDEDDDDDDDEDDDDDDDDD